jgi:hypothetical protein
MIIGSIKRYTHGPHGWAIGSKVMVVAIHRAGDVLTEDEAIGEIAPTDMVEFRPWIAKDSRFSFVTSDATIDQLEDL